MKAVLYWSYTSLQPSNIHSQDQCCMGSLPHLDDPAGHSYRGLYIITFHIAVQSPVVNIHTYAAILLAYKNDGCPVGQSQFIYPSLAKMIV